MNVLVLAGTGDGHSVAQAVRATGRVVIESVAGRTAAARRSAGDGVRVGGFGGADGLAQWLREHAIGAVVDATHPFARQMTTNAVEACARVGVPLARWVRPSWLRRPESLGWLCVPDHAAAVRAAAGHGRVLLTVGRQELAAYRALPDVIARVTEPAAGWVTPPGWELLIARGPFDRVSERDLMAERGVRVLVTKDSGGATTEAKLDAAAALGVQVVMITRPPDPEGIPRFSDHEAIARWIAEVDTGSQHERSVRPQV
ncbi:MAG: cobalt-precorrin-6A reductase [Propionibacteriaceae bacterium]|nr:cobalt-precorrin-6A reductase [Propionibacteriaceae bacterium]